MDLCLLETDSGLFYGTKVLCSDLPAVAVLGAKRTALTSGPEAAARSGLGTALPPPLAQQAPLCCARVALRYSRLPSLNLL